MPYERYTMRWDQDFEHCLLKYLLMDDEGRFLMLWKKDGLGPTKMPRPDVRDWRKDIDASKDPAHLMHKDTLWPYAVFAAAAQDEIQCMDVMFERVNKLEVDTLPQGTVALHATYLQNIPSIAEIGLVPSGRGTRGKHQTGARTTFFGVMKPHESMPSLKHDASCVTHWEPISLLHEANSEENYELVRRHKSKGGMGFPANKEHVGLYKTFLGAWVTFATIPAKMTLTKVEGKPSGRRAGFQPRRTVFGEITHWIDQNLVYFDKRNLLKNETAWDAWDNFQSSQAKLVETPSTLMQGHPIRDGPMQFDKKIAVLMAKEAEGVTYCDSYKSELDKLRRDYKWDPNRRQWQHKQRNKFYDHEKMRVWKEWYETRVEWLEERNGTASDK